MLVGQVLESLDWVGVLFNFDEEHSKVVYETSRTPQYIKALKAMVREETAYLCYCSSSSTCTAHCKSATHDVIDLDHPDLKSVKYKVY